MKYMPRTFMPVLRIAWTWPYSCTKSCTSSAIANFHEKRTPYVAAEAAAQPTFAVFAAFATVPASLPTSPRTPSRARGTARPAASAGMPGAATASIGGGASSASGSTCHAGERCTTSASRSAASPRSTTSTSTPSSPRTGSHGGAPARSAKAKERPRPSATIAYRCAEPPERGLRPNPSRSSSQRASSPPPRPFTTSFSAVATARTPVSCRSPTARAAATAPNRSEQERDARDDPDDHPAGGAGDEGEQDVAERGAKDGGFHRERDPRPFVSERGEPLASPRATPRRARAGSRRG